MAGAKVAGVGATEARSLIIDLKATETGVNTGVAADTKG
jgi:hypothetical protein